MRLTYVTMAYPCFHPGGSRLVFQANTAGHYDLLTVDLPQANRRTIVDSPGNDITPVYSPDGKRIVFVSDRDGNREVYVCDDNGLGQKNLTNKGGNDIHPVWSADGKRLLFSSNRGNADPEDFDIYEMNADGSGLKQITKGRDVDTYASWSPDGKQIVTRRVIDGNSEVFLMNADGSNPRNLTNSPNYDGWPNWRPDGKFIVFSTGPEADPAGRAANMKVYVMRADGSGKTIFSHPPTGSEWIYDTQPVFSHDGKQIAFTRYKRGVMESSDIAFQPFDASQVL